MADKEMPGVVNEKSSIAPSSKDMKEEGRPTAAPTTPPTASTTVEVNDKAGYGGGNVAQAGAAAAASNQNNITNNNNPVINVNVNTAATATAVAPAPQGNIAAQEMFQKMMNSGSLKQRDGVLDEQEFNGHILRETKQQRGSYQQKRDAALDGVFDTLDADKNGNVTKEEILEPLKAAGAKNANDVTATEILKKLKPSQDRANELAAEAARNISGVKHSPIDTSKELVPGAPPGVGTPAMIQVAENSAGKNGGRSA